MNSKLLLLIPAALILCACSPAHSTSTDDTATWTWTAPTTFLSGATIPTTDVITYQLYTGSAKGAESATPSATVTVPTALTSGYTPGQTVCGYVTATINSIESGPSNEACKTFVDTPHSPINLVVK